MLTYIIFISLLYYFIGYKRIWGKIILFKDKTYWAEENIIVNEDVLSKLTDIDFVFTHSSPKFCEPLSKIGIQIFLNDDTKLRDDLNKERADITRIYDILKINNKISKWCYGHFHNSYYLNKDGVDFYGLDELELKSVYK